MGCGQSCTQNKCIALKEKITRGGRRDITQKVSDSKRIHAHTQKTNHFNAFTKEGRIRKNKIT